MLRIAAYNFKAIAEGALSLVPGTARLFVRPTLGSGSARYCYSVWMRHMIHTAAWRHTPLDGLVVELGPGDSLGIGLAALLSGAARYIAVDVVRHADVARNLTVLAELAQLFTARAPVPGPEEFPQVKPGLADYAFPHHLLDDEQLERNLAPSRLDGIAAALRGEADADPLVRYVDPALAQSILPMSVCHIFSQAVLEHVDDLPGVYAACHTWLAGDGSMSHQIDFKSHGTARVWNGHWAYPSRVWRLLRGRRPYLLNREPCGTHLRLLRETGFEILAVERQRQQSRLRGDQLARPFRGMADEDLTTAGAFVVARKPDGHGR